MIRVRIGVAAAMIGVVFQWQVRPVSRFVMGFSNGKMEEQQPSFVAYLTIDDVPSPDMERKIKYLDEKCIPVTWFCQGQLLEQRPEMALLAINRGQLIGNHSYNHLFFSKISNEEWQDQISKTDAIIDDLYKEGGSHRPAKAFRFPYGDKGAEVDSNRAGEIQKFLKHRRILDIRFA